jgi:hypothetical protein
MEREMNQLSSATYNCEAMQFQRIPQECDAFIHMVTLVMEGTLPPSELPELRQELQNLTQQH